MHHTSPPFFAALLITSECLLRKPRARGEACWKPRLEGSRFGRRNLDAGRNTPELAHLLDRFPERATLSEEGQDQLSLESTNLGRRARVEDRPPFFLLSRRGDRGFSWACAGGCGAAVFFGFLLPLCLAARLTDRAITRTTQLRRLAETGVLGTLLTSDAVTA